ncbi:MAG: aldo/keto reductase [Solirubrobacteraceae bacterium]
MAHRSLGTSGPSVSRIALGSWRTFERMRRDDAERLLAHALRAGIDFLDDARYDDETGQAPLPTGYSEVLFGELFAAVRAPRDRITVSNKLWWEFWPSQDAVSELEGSLERMGFDRIDLLYSSTLPDELRPEEAAGQIAAVLATGRVGAWGVVNWSAQALDRAAREAQRLSIPAPCAVQLPYSLARRDWVEDPAMEAALAACGASLVPSAVLAGGALSGKYGSAGSGSGESGSAGFGSGAGRLSSELGDPRHRRALELGAALRPVAEQLGCTPAALAIAFTLGHPRTAATLIGATTPGQIDEAIAAVDLAERADVRAALRAL